MHLTSLQLCQLIDREYTWLDTRRRVARARLAGCGAGIVGAQGYLPLSSFDAGATFDATDVMRMAVAVEAERLGCTFDAGARLAMQADVAQVLTYDGRADLFAVAAVTDGAWRYFCGPLPSASAAPAGAVAINLTALLRQLRKRAALIGLAWAAGASAGAAQPRARLPDVIRPPRATL